MLLSCLCVHQVGSAYVQTTERTTTLGSLVIFVSREVKFWRKESPNKIKVLNTFPNVYFGG